MQAKAHRHLVVLDGRLETLMLPIVSNVLELIDASKHFQESKDRHVSDVAVFSGELDLFKILFSLEFFRVGEFPHN